LNRWKLIAVLLYSVVALITAGAGIRFLFATEYFAYHAQASGMDWSSVDAGLQTLALSGFRIIGAGFLTVSLGMTLMIFIPFAKYEQRWSYFAIPACGILFWSISLTTSLWVSSVTQAVAPWRGSLFCVLVLLFAMTSSLYELKSFRGGRGIK